MLDLDLEREGAVPADAATVLLVRDGAGGLEVFCVERNKKSRFLGGAIVFPGGKVDASDRDARWADLSTPAREVGEAAADFAPGDAMRDLGVAACRESLEEAALLPIAGGALTDAHLLALRAELANDADALATALAARGLRLDLAALRPFARWITPAAEARRFDARFFLARAPEGQSGAHDERATMASFWARPVDLLARFVAGEVQLAPPTHRCLELLLDTATADDALAVAGRMCLLPICPRVVMQAEPGGTTMALTLPGDPEHPVREARVPGLSRYVLRGARWVAESSPDGTPGG